MWRLVIYIVIGLAVAWSLALWLDNPGDVVVNWWGREIHTSFALLVFAFAAILAISLVIQSLYHWAKRDMPFVGENRHLKRQQKGLTYLNRAIVALAAGDGKAARKLVAKAQKRLPPQPMMHVVAAQAARLSGDVEAARLEFEGLMKDPDAAFLGVRGLLVNAVHEGRGSEARRLAEKAVDLNPKSAWAIKTLFDLEVKATDWDKARVTLEDGKRAKAFTKQETDKLLATLNYCQAKEADLEGNRKEARRLVGLALRTKKDFLPAVLMAARLDTDSGHRARAGRILEAAWALNPHPDFARAYARLEAMETDIARYKRFQKLAKKNPGHPESHLLLAGQAIVLEKFNEAEKHIDKVLDISNRAKALELRAIVEARRGSPKTVIEEWQHKSARGAPEPLWQCTNCGAEAEKWTLTCPTCKMFNTLEWFEPTEKVKAAGPKEESEFLVMLPDPSRNTKK